ncbi:MAG: transporter ATP-binding protein [Sphaerisporangium sp.]|nr:transporter ATP-binding protein [Sphaerisporangium sp.]
MSDPLLRVEQVSKAFPIRGGGSLQALRNVDFEINDGEAVGLIGESGSGKSTFARIVVGLERASAGRVHFQGREIGGLRPRRRRAIQRDIQMVFQDSRASMNPRLRIHQIVAEPLLTHGLDGSRRHVIELLERVGLGERFADLYPHQLSGGQRQRVAIARAVSTKPRLIVADEPVSALDVSVQGQVLNLLKSLQEEYGTAFLFVSHDLGVVKFFCDRVSVLYLGRVLENGVAGPLLSSPNHPYTRALASAAPSVRVRDQRQRIVLSGELPSPENPPSGCCFHPRCPEVIPDLCATVEPGRSSTEPGMARCHLLTPARTTEGAS